MTSQSQAETVQQREERVRNNWKQDQVFARSIEQRTEAEFVFYEGPPTANGLPHVGHALGRTVKDAVARYKTMQGFRVERKAGWDTHGLPVELGVENNSGSPENKRSKTTVSKHSSDAVRKASFPTKHSGAPLQKNSATGSTWMILT